MRFVGQTEIAAFLAEWPVQGESVRAWLAEIKYREWPSAAALGSDFRSADVSGVPTVVFYLSEAGVRIETLVDFRTGVVMLRGIGIYTTKWRIATDGWTARHDH